MSINTLPKAELHVHLEGTIPPALVRRLAERNKMTLPERLFADEDNFAWGNFQEFLDTYELASSVIRDPRDYYDITYEYLARCAQEGTLYVEMMYSPEHAERASGIASKEHLIAIDEAIHNARENYHIEGRIIMTCVSHYGAESTVSVAKHAAEVADMDIVVGFGMGGDEVNHPPEMFVEAFTIAHNAGLHCTTHAGEMCGAERVHQAINLLPLRRVGHGVRAIESADVIQELVDKEITLEVCPLSNIALNVFPSIQHHPLRQLIDAGIKVTLNSDDPPYFNTTIGKEYRVAHEDIGLTENELTQLTINAINASFADETTKRELLGRISAL